MQELRLGEIIRRRRKELNISQEILCEGLCEPGTLSRFETGRVSLSRKRVAAILQRLGMPDNRFYALLSDNEIAIEEAEREARCASVYLERAPEEERSAAWARFREKLAALEALGPEDPFIRQRVLSLQAGMGREEGPYGFEERLGMQLEAIRLTAPRFDLEHVGLGPYSVEELRLIRHIAATYTEAEQYEKALDIYRMALEYLEANGQRLPQYSALLAHMTYGCGRVLYGMGRWQETLDILEAGHQACVESARYHVLAFLLWLRAECYFQLGDTQKSTELFHQAHHVLKATGDGYYLPALDAEVQELLGITFPY